MPRQSSGDIGASSASGALTISPRAARVGLIVLTLINLLNYLDRYIVAALIESLKKQSELGITDTQAGWLGTGFILVYTLASPVFGALGDKGVRTRLIAIGVGVWSLATVLGGFAVGFTSLFLARSTIGIGEAAYGTISPGILADYYPKSRRGRIFAIFFAAIPIGAALGFIVGGFMDQHFGWRSAFFVAGAPGLLLALLVLRLPEPVRGANDEPEEIAERQSAPAGSWWRRYIELGHNKPYRYTILGYAASTFALGGLAFWMPAFLQRVHGQSSSEATLQFGGIVVVTGFVGTFAGGWAGDYVLRYTKHAYLLVCGVATLLAVPCAYVAVTADARSVYLPALVCAEILMFASSGPVNSAIVNYVLPKQRATAVALSILTIHLLGDVPSPWLIGFLSDGGGGTAASLQHAVLVVPAAILVAGIIWTWAALTKHANSPSRLPA